MNVVKEGLPNIVVELMFLKVLMLNRKKPQESVKFGAINIFSDKEFGFQASICNGCHEVLMMSIYPSIIDILNISVIDYCCVVSRISKSKAIKHKSF